MIPISGEQYELTFEGYRASIASVGASIRSLTIDGRDLVVPFDADEVRPHFRGATLAPWPNRVIDGTYSFGGEDYLLDLSEPKRGHALHGLVAWQDFALVSQVSNRLALATTIEARYGYPFRLDILVEFTLDADGLHTLVTATNTGADDAPYGVAPHPYLVAGSGQVDDWTLTLPADTVMTVTEDRLIPTGAATVADGGFDFRSGRQLGDIIIDHAFTDLTAFEVTITSPEGTGVAMTWDEACPWVQVHTADQPDPAISRLGLAVEPMTCPPDAFNSGLDLIVIAPGESSSAGWAIRGL